MLGIIIGVAAVIAMIAIGGGAQARVREQMKSLGSNLMLVLPGLDHRRRAPGRGAAQTLTEEDALRSRSRSRGAGRRAVAARHRPGGGRQPELVDPVLRHHQRLPEARDWPLPPGATFEPADEIAARARWR
jgi:putative ABC transport system permease protein